MRLCRYIIRASGDSLRIVFRRSRSTFGLRPSANHTTTPLALSDATGDKGTPDEVSYTPFCQGPGGNGRTIFHSDLLDAWLCRPLLDAGPLCDEASAYRSKGGHRVDGRVRCVQLRPAPFRRLPWRPFSFKSKPFRWRHGAAGIRLRMHRYRHAAFVLRRPFTFPPRQRIERDLHQHDVNAAVHP